MDREIEASDGYQVRKRIRSLERSYFVFEANHINSSYACWCKAGRVVCVSSILPDLGPHHVEVVIVGFRTGKESC